MPEAIAIFLFWLVGGAIGYFVMARLIAGFPSRGAVEFFAIVWGLLVAVVARLLIDWFSLSVIAIVATYIVGIVVSGTTRKQTNPPESRALDAMLMNVDYTYYKKEVLGFLPPIVYVVTSVVLFFAWR